MTRFNSMRVMLAVGLVLLVVLAACGAPSTTPTTPTSGAGAPVRGGTLTIANPNEPRTLDSRFDMLQEGNEVSKQFTEGLLEVDLTATGEKFVPGLAESYTVSSDGKRYEFNLRKGIKFHSGTEMTSDDVKFTFGMITGEIPGGQYVALFAPFLQRVEAPEPYKVVITLKQPWADFPSMLAKATMTRVLSRKVVEAAGKEYGQSVFVGTGPFVVKEWVKGSHVTVVRNTDYWRKDLPYLDSIIYRRIPDATSRLIQAKAGQVDVVVSPPLDQIQQAKSDASLKVLTHPGNGVVFIRFNTSSEPFSDKRLRQAIYYGLNRKQLVESYYGDLAVEFTDLYPAWFWAHDPNFKGVPFDQTKAKQLLAEAGYGPSNPLTFDFYCVAESEFSQLAVLIQAQLKEIGVNVTIKQLSQAALDELEVNKTLYKAALERLGLPQGGADDYVYKQFGAAAPINRVYLNEANNMRNPDIEDLINRARTAKDQTEGKPLYRQLATRLTDEAAVVRIANKNAVVVTTSRVQNYLLQGSEVFEKRDVWLQVK